MTVSKLRDHLRRLTEPVEVDAIGDVVDKAERKVFLQVDALTDRIVDAIDELRHHRDEVLEMTAKVDALDNATGAGKGLMATIRASLANDDVEEARERAAVDLASACAVLERRVQRALALAEDTRILSSDVDFALDALSDLGRRARLAELKREAHLINRAVSRLSALVPTLPDLANPLSEPVGQARAASNKAREQIGELRSTERAATVGETMLDSVLSPQGRGVSQKLRRAVGETVPSLVPDVERESVEHQDALAHVDGKLRAARESARKEEELRRAAEAELDALEWDR